MSAACEGARRFWQCSRSGVTPAPAGATAQDVAATHSYIQAGYALARVAVASLGRVQAGSRATTGACGRNVPGVGAGSPEDEASQVASNEVADALWSIGYGTDAPQIHAFFEKTRGLRWSNAAITRAAHAFAGDLNQLATSPLPDLCSDVAAWKQTGFQSFPAASATLVSRIQAIEPSPSPRGYSRRMSVDPTPACLRVRRISKARSANSNSFTARPTGTRCSKRLD